MLYKPEAFEQLTDEPWDEARARERVQTIVDQAERTFDPVVLWPQVTEWDAPPTARQPLTRLYSGAAGVIWALDMLRHRGHADVSIDLPAAAIRAREKFRDTPDTPERKESPAFTYASLFFGESGPLLVAYKLAPSDELADALYARVRQNWDAEGNELMSGAPGTMIAAKAMLDWTGDERWADAWRESAEELWRRRYLDGFWTYPPFGKSPGAAHGIGTNTSILLAGGDLFPQERRDEVARDTGAALARIAVREDGLANWPMSTDDCGELEWDGEIRVQWCHGGAGVVASAAQYLDEELLLAGAELVWRAGPQNMEKGPGICHGTAGNGYALLKTFERTGDEAWLDRARRFSVHALDHVERWREKRGSGRDSLWTGDFGAAIFASDCLDARTGVPIVDYVS